MEVTTMKNKWLLLTGLFLSLWMAPVMAGHGHHHHHGDCDRGEGWWHGDGGGHHHDGGGRHHDGGGHHGGHGHH